MNNLMATYAIKSPVSTHRRQATCAEVGCEAYLYGWKTIVPVASEYEALCRASRRKFTESKVESHLIEFIFEAGQPCFSYSKHTVAVGRPELFLVKQGTNPARTHTRPEHWVEDFSEHLAKVKKDRS